MIRIEISADELGGLINDADSGWLDRAEEKTAELEADPSIKITSIWSSIKKVFTTLQHSKCVFCEKEIEDQPIEQDVEHYRPKNSVRRWIVPQWMEDDEGITVNQPSSGTESGYSLLAYNYLNYAASCKTCNSTRKRNFFPIAGQRTCDSKSPATMNSEKAYLIFPIGDIDENPEGLIEFYGVSPQAKKNSGFGRKRALVTIEIFQLDSVDKRRYLFKARARWIWTLFQCLLQIDNGNSTEKLQAELVADHLTSPASEHTNCLRSFRKLYLSNFDEAKTIADEALILWTSGSP